MRGAACCALGALLTCCRLACFVPRDARSYYESIQIHGGGQPMAVLTPAHSSAPALASPLLLAAVVAVGAWAALTAALARNFDLTTYKASRKWQLLLLWPLLLPLSAAFRAQFLSALRGEKVRVLDSIDGGDSSSGNAAGRAGS